MLFLTLNTFSKTGGIEKVCRIASKVFREIAREEGKDFQLYSLYDEPHASSEPYIRKKDIRPFAGKRFLFVVRAVLKGIRSKTVIISHINLALPAYLIKIFSPRTRLIVMAHGIEVWRPLKGIRKKLLAKADHVVAVSEFTRQRIHEGYLVRKSTVINNCIDPFLAEAPHISKEAMRHKLGLKATDFVLLTVSRISASEAGKNYDKILKALAALLPQAPDLHYIMVGKYDEEEKKRIERHCQSLGLQSRVHITGYISDAELPSYYGCADLYIMPSKKEGFGITFIEAMYYGLPVIGGHRGGTTDALLQGRLGLLVDPDRQEEITSAIAKILCNPCSFKPDRPMVLGHFGFEAYRKKWERVLKDTGN